MSESCKEFIKGIYVTGSGILFIYLWAILSFEWFTDPKWWFFFLLTFTCATFITHVELYKWLIKK